MCDPFTSSFIDRKKYTHGMLHATCYCTHGLNPPHGSKLTIKKAVKYNFLDAQKKKKQDREASGQGSPKFF